MFTGLFKYLLENGDFVFVELPTKDHPAVCSIHNAGTIPESVFFLIHVYSRCV